MANNLKKFIQINHKNKLLFVATITDGTSEDYIKAKKEAEKNLNDLFTQFLEEQEEMEKRVAQLEAEVKTLKGED